MADENIKPVIKQDDDNTYITYSGLNGKDNVTQVVCIGEPLIALAITQMHPGTTDKPARLLEFRGAEGFNAHYFTANSDKKITQHIFNIPLQYGMAEKPLIGQRTIKGINNRDRFLTAIIPMNESNPLMRTLERVIRDFPKLKEKLPAEFGTLGQVSVEDLDAGKLKGDESVELPEPEVLPSITQPQPDGPYKGAQMVIFQSRRGEEIIPLGEDRYRPDGSLYSKLELEPDGSGSKTLYFPVGNVKTEAPMRRSVIKFGSAELDNRLLIETAKKPEEYAPRLKQIEAMLAKPENSKVILDYSQQENPKVSQQECEFIIAAHNLAVAQKKEIKIAGLSGRGKAFDEYIPGPIKKKIERLPSRHNVCLLIHDIHKMPESRTDYKFPERHADYVEAEKKCYEETFTKSGDLDKMFEFDASDSRKPITVRQPLDVDILPQQEKEPVPESLREAGKPPAPGKPKLITKEIAVTSEKSERVRKISYLQETGKDLVELGYEEFRADGTLYSRAVWNEKGGGTLTVFYPSTPDPMKPDEPAPEVKRTVFTFSGADFAAVNNKILLKPGADYDLAKVEAAEMADKSGVREVVLDFGAHKTITAAECQLIKEVQAIVGPAKKSLKLAGLANRSNTGEQSAIDDGLKIGDTRTFIATRKIEKLRPGFTTIPAIHALGKVLARREDFKAENQESASYIEEYNPVTGALIGSPYEPITADRKRDAAKRQFDDGVSSSVARVR